MAVLLQITRKEWSMLFEKEGHSQREIAKKNQQIKVYSEQLHKKRS